MDDRAQLVEALKAALTEQAEQQGLKVERWEGETAIFLQGEGVVHLSLENILRAVDGEPREAWGHVLREHLANVTNIDTLTAPLTFDQAKPLLRTVVLETKSGNEHLMAEPWVRGLKKVVAIDHPTALTFIMDYHLTKWGTTFGEVLDLGLANLRAASTKDGWITVAEDIWRYNAGDETFHASRSLILGAIPPPDRAENQGWVIAFPNRDVLMATPVRGKNSLPAVDAVCHFAGMWFTERHHPIYPFAMWFDGETYHPIPRLEGAGQAVMVFPDALKQILARDRAKSARRADGRRPHSRPRRA